MIFFLAHPGPVRLRTHREQHPKPFPGRAPRDFDRVPDPGDPGAGGLASAAVDDRDDHRPAPGHRRGVRRPRRQGRRRQARRGGPAGPAARRPGHRSPAIQLLPAPPGAVQPRHSAQGPKTSTPPAGSGRAADRRRGEGSLRPKTGAPNTPHPPLIHMGRRLKSAPWPSQNSSLQKARTLARPFCYDIKITITPRGMRRRSARAIVIVCHTAIAYSGTGRPARAARG